MYPTLMAWDQLTSYLGIVDATLLGLCAGGQPVGVLLEVAGSRRALDDYDTSRRWSIPKGIPGQSVALSIQESLDRIHSSLRSLASASPQASRLPYEL